MKLKTSWIIIGVILFAAILATLNFPGRDPYAKLRGTERDLDATLAAGRPSIIELGTKSCPFCKALYPILAKLGSEYAGRLNVLIVDVDEQVGVARRYNVTAVPVILFYDAQGKQLRRFEGFMSYDDLKAAMASHKLVP